jgi:hypothetical protein
VKETIEIKIFRNAKALQKLNKNNCKTKKTIIFEIKLLLLRKTKSIFGNNT